MPAETELGVKLVPDESALDNIEDREIGVSGSGDGEGRELDEERNEKLQVMTRGIGRIASRLGTIAVIAAILAGIAKAVGELTDIGFEDVRDGIVTALNQLKDQLLQTLGITGGGTSSEESGRRNRRMIGQNLALSGAPFGGLPLLSSLNFEEIKQQIRERTEGNNGSNSGDGRGGSDTEVRLFTSRDSLTGDSTQQEMETQNFEFFNVEGGS